MRYARKLWRRETINTLGSWEAVRSRFKLPKWIVRGRAVERKPRNIQKGPDQGPWLGEAVPQPEGSSVCAQHAPGCWAGAERALLKPTGCIFMPVRKTFRGTGRPRFSHSSRAPLGSLHTPGP